MQIKNKSALRRNDPRLAYTVCPGDSASHGYKSRVEHNYKARDIKCRTISGYDVLIFPKTTILPAVIKLTRMPKAESGLSNYLKSISLGRSFSKLGWQRNELIYFPPMPSVQIFAQKSKLSAKPTKTSDGGLWAGGGGGGTGWKETCRMHWKTAETRQPNQKAPQHSQWMYPLNSMLRHSANIFEEYFPINKVCHNNSLWLWNLQHVTSYVHHSSPSYLPLSLSIYIFAAIYGADEAKQRQPKEQPRNRWRRTLYPGRSPWNFKHFRWHSAKTASTEQENIKLIKLY